MQKWFTRINYPIWQSPLSSRSVVGAAPRHIPPLRLSPGATFRLAFLVFLFSLLLMFSIAPSARLRASPYFDSTVRCGVTSFSTYNNMLLPTGYGDPESEYWRLIEGVSLWDVACQRQVEIRGRDASHLVRILCPRDLSSCSVGQGKYVGLCNHSGVLINDPVILRISDDCFWLSLADSNILFWASAIANERRLDVEICEPDVSPLAIQGPKSGPLARDLFGDWTNDLRYFWFREAELEGIPLIVARSGWSKQGGFELYLRDGTRGDDLWNIVSEAGAPYDIGPGNPNANERVESGLLSFGGDTDEHTNPFEVRMGRYIDLDVPDDVIGIESLRRIDKEGARRHQLGVILDCPDPDPSATTFRWFDITLDNELIGHMTNIAWSYRLKKNIGFALVSSSVSSGSGVIVDLSGTPTSGELVDLPFL